MTTTIADAIAIKILRNGYILTGVGNELHLYSNSGSGSCVEKQVLDVRLRGKVHGIEQGSASSANLLCVHGEKEFVLIQEENGDFKEVVRAYLSDWISAAHFLKETGHLVLLTAHSVLIKYNTSKGQLEKDCMVSCTDKSTLYCGSIYGNKWENLVIFGGNAFGELLIWQPTAKSSNDNLEKVDLLHRISAHNGVIFSICYDANSNLLTTTSDDRSIRFWKVKINNKNWKEANLEPLISGYGHIARVFKGKIIKNDGKIFVITVGEDSFVCIWKEDGTLLFKKRQQFGAVIWNFEYEKDTKTLLTVGSTGNLIGYNLKNLLGDTQDSLKSLPVLEHENKHKYIAKIKFLHSDILVGITNINQFVYMNVKDEKKWSYLKDFAGFKCTVLEVYEDLIALCGYKRVVIYKFHKLDNGDSSFELILDINLLEGIIRAFQFLNSEVFLVSDEAGNCKLIKISNGKIKSYQIELPKCKERWLTSAILLDKNYLIVSNRLGNIMLYFYCSLNDSYTLKDILKHPHGNLGATLFTKGDINDERLLIKTAGHDASLKVISVDRKELSLRIIRRKLIPISWVEAIIKPETDSEEILLGFNDNHFVAWSKSKDFHLQIPCGGGHRCWHYILSKKKHKIFLNLVFIRNKQVLIQRLELFNSIDASFKPSPPNTWHVRACNIAKLLNAEDEAFLISAGEDNLVKISVADLKNKRLLQLCEIHSHISNIRSLCFAHKNQNEYLIFSVGGRAQLCINQFNTQTRQIEELLSFMLTDRENHNEAYNFDPETRLMSIDVLHEKTSDTFYIYLACSDGFLRKLKWAILNEPSIEKESYYGKCLLQTRLVAEKYLLVASTDGYIHFYDLNLENSLAKILHHQSGINAFDIYLDEEEEQEPSVHILSGGDDQAVSYSKVNLESFDIINSWHLPFLHTAQVTAAYLSKDVADNLLAFTSGVDQNVFKLNLKNGKVLKDYHSCVADVKGLCLDLNGNCYLYGCGLQIFNFNQ